jgi:hypothetical protein
VNDDGLPAETGSPVSEDVQQRGIDFLQGLLASGKVDLDRFQKALDALLEVHTQADFASVVRGLPSPVEFTPPARRRQEPLEISTSMGDVRLEGRWQVSRLTKIDTGMGNVTIDLSQAEFDDWDVKVVVRTGMGTITVIVPRGLEVRPVGRSGPVTTTLEPPIPGFPVVRLSATSNMGAIRVMHPTEKKQRRQRWRRRHRRDLPRPCTHAFLGPGRCRPAFGYQTIVRLMSRRGAEMAHLYPQISLSCFFHMRHSRGNGIFNHLRVHILT